MTLLSSSFYDSPFHGFRCLHSAGETIFKFSSSSPGRTTSTRAQRRLARGREPPCVTNFSPTQHSSRVCLLLRAKGFVNRLGGRRNSSLPTFLRFQLFGFGSSIMETNNSWKNSSNQRYRDPPLIPIINGER